MIDLSAIEDKHLRELLMSSDAIWTLQDDVLADTISLLVEMPKAGREEVVSLLEQQIAHQNGDDKSMRRCVDMMDAMVRGLQTKIQKFERENVQTREADQADDYLTSSLE